MAVEIRNVVLLLLLLSPIVHAGSPTMFTGVELVRSNLPWARGGGGAYAICTPVAIFIIINIGSASAPRGAPHFEKFTMTLLSRRTNLIVLLLASVLTSASWPRLACQRADYLANQLRSFKAKERNNDPSALMRQVAARMSDDDIAAVAAYLSGAR